MRTRWPLKRLTSFRANYRRRRNGNVRARNVKNDSTSDQVGPLTEVFHFFNFLIFFKKKADRWLGENGPRVAQSRYVWRGENYSETTESCWKFSREMAAHYGARVQHRRRENSSSKFFKKFVKFSRWNVGIIWFLANLLRFFLNFLKLILLSN